MIGAFALAGRKCPMELGVNDIRISHADDLPGEGLSGAVPSNACDTQKRCIAVARKRHAIAHGGKLRA